MFQTALEILPDTLRVGGGGFKILSNTWQQEQQDPTGCLLLLLFCVICELHLGVTPECRWSCEFVVSCFVCSFFRDFTKTC